MKKVLSLFMAVVMLASCLSVSMSAYALDISQIKTGILSDASDLPCDSQWREYNGKLGVDRDFYKITVAQTGKLNVKIEAYSFLEATLSSADLATDYFTVFSLASSQPETVFRNQVISAGTYYLSVQCSGRYKINATFGGNCYENPQKLSAGTEVTGASTEADSGWWYVINVPSDALYTFNTASYGSADITIYNDELTAIIDQAVYSGSSANPSLSTKNIYLIKGKYYIKVNSDGKYKLSWYKLTQANCSHSYTHQYVKATYIAKGYQLHTCTVCGYSYKDSYTAKKILSAPSVRSIKKGSKQITVSINRSFNATGYQIQYSTSNKFTGKTVKTVTTKDTTKKIKKLKGRKKYYVRVRAYKKVSGKTVYSSWTEVQSIITKK